MEFRKLPTNSKKLLDEIIQSENPVQMLCERFERASKVEDEELRGILRELRAEGFINTKWADNKPYHITINNSARTYNEQLEEYEKMSQSKAVYYIGAVNDKSITIGDGNKISNSKLTDEIINDASESKKSFYEKHPIICSLIISLIAGIVLLFSFWTNIISWFEELF